MSISLLVALAKYYRLVEKATKNPAIIAPSGLDFVPGPGDDLESMIWVIAYAIMLHHQGSLQGSDKADYQHSVVNKYYGSLSYSGLADKRSLMLFYTFNPLADGPEDWIPDPEQRKWFIGAMTLISGQIKPPSGGSNNSITFDAFDALCDEFITDE